MSRVGFARWSSSLPSGGNRYDAELTAGLPTCGVDLREYPVGGSWPLPGEQDRRGLAAMLEAEQHWLVGNIIATAVPELVRGAVASGRSITVLMHYFPADDPSLVPADRQRLEACEAEVVAAATRVVVTSEWAGREVLRRYGRGDVAVAVPGTDRAQLAHGSGSVPGLLWLGRMTSTKDPLTFVDALAHLTDLEWRARLVGPAIPGEDADRLTLAHIAEHGLDDRVAVTGALTGDSMASTWDATDLLVHTSRAETYGMVVSEALARGIPSIVADGTGAVEAQAGIGATFPPGDPDALAKRLRAWLTDDALRRHWCGAAEAARPLLPTWLDTARAVASALSR